MDRSRIRTESTSRQTADATSLVLRSSERVRLLFRPQLVENAQNPEAAVSGIIVYQRKRVEDEWDDADAINLSTLKAGEGVRLELHTAEVLALYEHLSRLYTVAAEHGVAMGVREFVTLPPHQLIEEVAALLDAGAEPELLRVFVDWLKAQDRGVLSDAVRDASVDELVNFDAALGVVRLRRVLDEMESNRNNADEAYWQNLFAINSWVLAQLYAHPAVIIAGQVYVGGKSFENRGGTIGDFLYRNRLTDNALLVEIKTPATDLLKPQPYRNAVYSCSDELIGATQQLALARQRLIQEGRALADEDDPEFRVLSPRGVLLVGNTQMLTSTAQRRSFELFRNNLREMEVVCFDELFEKVRQLLELVDA